MKIAGARLLPKEAGEALIAACVLCFTLHEVCQPLARASRQAQIRTAATKTHYERMNEERRGETLKLTLGRSTGSWL